MAKISNAPVERLQDTLFDSAGSVVFMVPLQAFQYHSLVTVGQLLHIMPIRVCFVNPHVAFVKTLKVYELFFLFFVQVNVITHAPGSRGLREKRGFDIEWNTGSGRGFLMA